MQYEKDKYTGDMMRLGERKIAPSSSYHPNQRLEAARREIAEITENNSRLTIPFPYTDGQCNECFAIDGHFSWCSQYL